MSTPSELDTASKCYCFNDDQFRRVVVYLLDQILAGGGGGNVQDMQVTWTPTNIALGELLGFTNASNIPGITTITFNQSTSVGGFTLSAIGNDVLTSVSFPSLVSVDPTNLQGAGLDVDTYPLLTTFSAPLLQTVAGTLRVSGNTNASFTSLSFPSLITAGGILFQGNIHLVTLSIPVFVPTNGNSFDASNCALNVSSINAILARHVANAGYVSGVIDISGGTNAAPAGQGAADKATLIGRGVTVVTN